MLLPHLGAGVKIRGKSVNTAAESESEGACTGAKGIYAVGMGWWKAPPRASSKEKI